MIIPARPFILLAQCALVPLLAAQTDTCRFALSGQVLDAHDREPLSYAEVFIQTLGKGAVADEQGRYRIEGLCAATYRVLVSHLGCESIEREVRIVGDLSLDFRLEHHAEELRELEVVRDRPDENVGQSRMVLGRDAMDRAAGQGLGELLSTLPGVALQSTGPTIGKPVIHGLSGNRVLTLNQGIRQEDQQWGTEHAPSLDPLSSDRITVVKGAASVQYGSDAIGGVIITEPVELPRDAGIGGELRGLGQSNGQGGGGSGMLQGGVKGWQGFGWRMQGSGRYLGDSEAPGYVLSNTGVREAGASASIGYRDHRRSATVYYSWFQRELGILRAAHIGNLTDLDNAIASGEPWYIDDFTHAIDAPRQTAQHHLLKAEAGYAVTERSRLVATYGYQANDRQEYDRRRLGRSATPALDLWLATHTADAVLKHWIGGRVHGKAGISAVFQRNSNIPGTGVRPLIPDYRRESIGAFIVEHFPLSEKLELEAGARLESAMLRVRKYEDDNTLITPERDFTNAALTLGANWTVRDSVRMRFNLGTAYRPPHVSELYSEGLHHGAAAIEEGDAGLGSERAIKGTIDLQGSWLDGRLAIDATLHASRIDGYIYLRPDGTRLTIRGAFPVFAYTATDALLCGADATINLKLTGRWSWRIRGSTVLARDQREDEWLFLMPADRVDNTVMARWGELGEWRSLELSATSMFVFEQQRAPVGVDFTAPPEGYHLLGLAAAISRPMGNGDLRIGLQATNIFNAAYRDYMDRFRYYADARGFDLLLSVRYAFGRTA
ncbi:MAG: TonB-dependent receptor [Flavobacteriales bacterium]|nr:TonB-dependent receptor [Flavobacteriales bacterium]